VRPYLGHADAVVVPMRIARGIQNKVLEGMAMARPVIVSSKGLEGISARHGQEVLVADEAEDVSRCLCDVLRHGAHGVGLAARETVRRDYAWEGNARRLLDLVEGGRNAGCGVRNAD
jgi:glycosyltransferase involved in cell wall biosynthesis